jgi:hypothetical protein
MQQSADMIDVIVDAEALFDELSHARTRPEIGMETCCQRAFEQECFQAALLPKAKLGRSSRRGPSLDTRLTMLTCHSLPAAHTAPIDSDALGNLMGQKPLAKQHQSAQSTSFQFFRASSRSHGTPPTGMIGHYLSSDQ